MAVALMFIWTGADALWARLSEQELIEQSGLIVVGTVTAETTATDLSDGKTRAISVIEIDTVLKGDLTTKIVRLTRRDPAMPLSSSDITYSIGQKGLWFLRLAEPPSAAIYAADHPQRFVPYGDAGQAIESVRKYLTDRQ